ncbi:MAG: hypothetical protein IJT59_00915 [Desulfovibrionaceae bacterium]|nr:hypothetical protein [Desulfovibrionaceae bacterium]
MYARFVKFTWAILLPLIFLSLAGCAQLGIRPGRDNLNKDRQIALALPVTGSHANIVKKIVQGAKCAYQEEVARGVNLNLVVLDTSQKDWLKRLASLPKNCAVVGGPLDLPTYKKIKQANLLENRVFYPFLSRLEGYDEGQLAYRFFPSANDQAEALVDFANKKLKITSFGAFYPTDNYSQGMVKTFEQSLQRRHLPLKKATYDGSMPATWAKSAKDLINPSIPEFGGTPVPTTSFDAVFLPASWKHLDQLIGSFMANGEDRLVLMGTLVWEQSLAGAKFAKPQRFELAIFPGAWNNKIVLPAQAGKNDFWVSLGYDFVKFASHLNLDAKPSHLEIIDRSNYATRFIRSLAPITFDDTGHMHQKLFIYRLSANGMVQVDPVFFNQVRTTRKANAAMRFQSVSTPTTIEDISAPASGSIGDDLNPKPTLPQLAEPKPVRKAPVGILGTVPQSSHKLRLPTQRPANPAEF